MRIEGKSGMQGEVRSDAPTANDCLHDRLSAARKHAALAKGQVVSQVTVEQAGRIGDATPVVALGIVGILEEEAEAGLADASRKRFFITERPEVTQAVGHALRPRVVGLELKPLPGSLGQRDLQRVVALDTAGVVKPDRRSRAARAQVRAAGGIAVEQRLGK